MWSLVVTLGGFFLQLDHPNLVKVFQVVKEGKTGERNHFFRQIFSTACLRSVQRNRRVLKRRNLWLSQLVWFTIPMILAKCFERKEYYFSSILHNNIDIKECFIFHSFLRIFILMSLLFYICSLYSTYYNHILVAHYLFTTFTLLIWLIFLYFIFMQCNVILFVHALTSYIFILSYTISTIIIYFNIRILHIIFLIPLGKWCVISLCRYLFQMFVFDEQWSPISRFSRTYILSFLKHTILVYGILLVIFLRSH